MMPKTNLSLREILVRRSDWGRGICHTAAFSGVHHCGQGFKKAEARGGVAPGLPTDRPWVRLVERSLSAQAS